MYQFDILHGGFGTVTADDVWKVFVVVFAACCSLQCSGFDEFYLRSSKIIRVSDS